MKRWIGIASLLLLAFLLTAWPGGMFAKGARIEVKRMSITSTVPADPAPTGSCSGTFVHCVVLSWTAPTLNASGGALTGALTYDVYRSTVSGSGYAKITTAPVSAASYEDDAVVGGVTYFYVVVAYQTVAGTTSAASANSTQVSATGLPITIPNPPTGLQAVSF